MEQKRWAKCVAVQMSFLNAAAVFACSVTVTAEAMPLITHFSSQVPFYLTHMRK